MSAIRYRAYMDDSEYLKYKYKKKLGITLNLDNPVNFNEKNNWRKLYDRNPIYTDMVDKFKFKHLVEERCGAGYTIPLFGVWDNPKKINYDALPNNFVLKCNHSGGIIVCRDKNSFDKKSASRELGKFLKTNYLGNINDKNLITEHLNLFLNNIEQNKLDLLLIFYLSLSYMLYLLK